jgi:hypothetical protein
VVLLGVGYVGAVIVISNSAELTGAASYLKRANWAWIGAAAVVEALSYIAATQLTRRLLAAGSLRTSFGPICAISLAYNAMNTSLPGGGAFAAVFEYRQFRRRGADEALTTWTIVAFIALQAVTLAAISVVGLAIVGNHGPVGGLWPLIPLLVAIPILGVVILLRPRLLLYIAIPPLRLVRKVSGFPRTDPRMMVGALVERLGTVTPRLIDWTVGVAYALLSWGCDCSCLVLAFAAVDAHVPWRGLLVAYGAAQVAANLPITPGGLGVVEGSLTIALVAYGGSSVGSVAAVLLFRILSFWSPLPVGWVAWLGLRIQAGRNAVDEVTVVDEVEAVAM